MRKHFRTLLLPALALLASSAHGAAVEVGSDFLGGIYGNFNIHYQSGAAGLNLKEVTIELKTPLYTDPTFVPPGALLPFPFLSFSGAGTTGFTGVTGVYDGATSFTLMFDHFEAGETFNFELDVDAPCGGFGCLQLPPAITTGAEFAGSKIIGTFGGAGYNTTVLTDLYSSTGELTASAEMVGDVNTPEPGTFGLLGAALAFVGLKRRRRTA